MFITVNLFGTTNSPKAIAIDGISSMEPYLISYCRIVLKEVKKGENVEVLSSESYNSVANRINEIIEARKKG